MSNYYAFILFLFVAFCDSSFSLAHGTTTFPQLETTTKNNFDFHEKPTVKVEGNKSYSTFKIYSSVTGDYSPLFWIMASKTSSNTF